MKKRVFISLLLTVGAMVGTYKIWHLASIFIFISILILSFLSAYKLTDYIAEFKTVKNNSRIDITFLVIFFIFLCIPASYISKAEKAKNENRYLAKPPVFVKKYKLNQSYGKDFNAWFNDRFNLRNNIIRLNIVIKCSINANYCENSGTTYYKKGNLLYSSSYFGPEVIQKDKQKILDSYVSNVNKLQRYCDEENIKLYILIVPRQSEFFDYPLPEKRNYEPDPSEEIIAYMKANTKTNIIYPKEAMKEANKETPVFFKTDHHWTKKGAYTGYYELMKQIKKDFPAVQILQESSLEKYYDNRVSQCWNVNLHNGQTFKRIWLPKRYAKKILDTPYLYYKNPNKDKLQTNVELAPIPKAGHIKSQDNQFYYPEGINKKVMVIANSFAGNLVEFLPYSFKYTVRYYDNYRKMHMEVYKNVIETYKPDILIINMHTCSLYKLLNLYNNSNELKEDIE